MKSTAVASRAPLPAVLRLYWRYYDPTGNKLEETAPFVGRDLSQTALRFRLSRHGNNLDTADVLGHLLGSDFALFQKTPVSDITGEYKHN